MWLFFRGNDLMSAFDMFIMLVLCTCWWKVGGAIGGDINVLF